MFHPLSLYVGLRYVRARTRKFFVSFITWVSLVGVCIGVMALIVILSVMNGLENELRTQLVSLSAHARVVPRAADVRTETEQGAPPAESDWQNVQRIVSGAEGVKGVARYVEIQGLAIRNPDMLPVVLRGIDPQAEATVTDVAGSV